MTYTIRDHGAFRRFRDSELRKRLIADGNVAPGNDGMARDERAAIDAYLSKQTPRKYPENDSGDDWNLMLFLIGRGYRVYRNGGTGKTHAPVFINGVKTLRAKFIALVNREREKLGMMPLGVPA